jgi:hypothetical protein
LFFVVLIYFVVVGTAADIFAFGVVLHQLFFNGRSPRIDSERRELILPEDLEAPSDNALNLLRYLLVPHPPL